MQNCKRFKNLDDAVTAFKVECGNVYSPKLFASIEEANEFMKWLFDDDGMDYVNSPKQYKLADGRDLQDIFWEVSQYGSAYFCIFNSAKYEFRKGKKELAPPEEDMMKSDWYIKDVIKRTNHPYSEIRGKVDEILDRAYSVKPIA